MGPHEFMYSIYLLSSSSIRYAPFASLINIGVPPTALKALTGELTPPGICLSASLNNALLL